MRKQGFDKTQKGLRIDNIPDSGTLTGSWATDSYGCWWEYILDKAGVNDLGKYQDRSWLVGEYPESY